MPARSLVLLIGIAILLLFLGRVLLPLAVLLALCVATALWFAPEVAYLLDEKLWLHRLPGFGDDHRQMAAVSFAYLTALGILGFMLLGTVGQALDEGAVPSPSATPLAMLDPTEEIGTEPATIPVPSLPPLRPPPAPASAQSPATSPLEASTAPRPANPEPAPPKPAATTLPPSIATSRPAATPAVTQQAAESKPNATKPTAPAAAGGAAEFSAEIAGVTTVVAAGGRATLQARTTPGASCDLTVQYAAGAQQPVGAAIAGAGGLCNWSWAVPPGTASGWARATVTFRQGARSESRQVGFAIS